LRPCGEFGGACKYRDSANRFKRKNVAIGSIRISARVRSIEKKPVSQFIQFVVAVGAITGVFLAITRPHWAVVLIIALWPMEQLLQNYIAIFRQIPPLYNFCVAGLTSVALVMRLTRGQKVFTGFSNPVTMLVFALYLLWTAGLLYSPAQGYAVDVFKQSLPYLLLKLLIFPLLILNFEEMRKVVPALLIVGTGTCVLILIDPNSQFLGGRLMVDTGTHGRFGSPLAIAELGGLTALAAALYLPSRAGAIVTIMRAGAFLAGFAVAIGSGSRGQVFAAVSCGVLFYPLARRLNNPRQFFLNTAGLAILLLGIYFVFKQFIGYENEQRWSADLMSKDVEGRWLMIRQLLDAYLASPGSWIFGLGAGGYYAVSGGRGYVHNVPAEILCEHGLLGACIFIAIGLMTLRCARGLWTINRDDPTARSITAILFAICLNEFILTLKQGSVSDPTPFYWWIVLAKFYYQARHVAALDAQGAGDFEDEPGIEDQWEGEYGPDEDREYALTY
jgi:hypothetical protein